MALEVLRYASWMNGMKLGAIGDAVRRAKLGRAHRQEVKLQEAARAMHEQVTVLSGVIEDLFSKQQGKPTHMAGMVPDGFMSIRRFAGGFTVRLERASIHKELHVQGGSGFSLIAYEKKESSRPNDYWHYDSNRDRAAPDLTRAVRHLTEIHEGAVNIRDNLV